MSQYKKSPIFQCNLDRRELCKTIPCAAVGVFASTAVIKNMKSGGLDSTESFAVQEEVMANTITVKVISQKGSCAQSHQVGDIITITETGVEGKICIHALYAILPKVFAMMFDAQFPWLENSDVSTSACPDAYNPVVFEITRKKEV